MSLGYEGRVMELQTNRLRGAVHDVKLVLNESLTKIPTVIYGLQFFFSIGFLFLQMVVFSGRVVAVLVVAIALVEAEPSFRRQRQRQRCYPKTQYVTQYQTEYSQVRCGTHYT